MKLLHLIIAILFLSLTGCLVLSNKRMLEDLKRYSDKYPIPNTTGEKFWTGADSKKKKSILGPKKIRQYRSSLEYFMLERATWPDSVYTNKKELIGDTCCLSKKWYVTDSGKFVNVFIKYDSLYWNKNKVEYISKYKLTTTGKTFVDRDSLLQYGSKYLATKLSAPTAKDTVIPFYERALLEHIRAASHEE